MRWRSKAVTAVLAAGAFGTGAALHSPEGPVRGVASFRLQRPPVQTAAQIELLKSIAHQYAGSCRSITAAPDVPSNAALLEAVASVACTDAGHSVVATRYPSDETLQNGFQIWLRSSTAAGACNGRMGRTRWSSRAGRIKGSILCFQDDGVSHVVWTDEHARTVFAANGRDLAGLLRWWGNHARPADGGTPHAEGRLRRSLASVIDAAGCSPAPTAAPLSRAALNCEPERPDGRRFEAVEVVHVESFGTAAAMRARMAATGGNFAPTDAASGKTCASDALGSRENWGFHDRELGEVVCWPEFMYYYYAFSIGRRRQVIVIGATTRVAARSAYFALSQVELRP